MSCTPDALVAPRPGDLLCRPGHARFYEVVVARAPDTQSRRLHAGQVAEGGRFGLGRNVSAVRRNAQASRSAKQGRPEPGALKRLQEIKDRHPGYCRLFGHIVWRV
jgi:hypothetical protein